MLWTVLHSTVCVLVIYIYNTVTYCEGAGGDNAVLCLVAKQMLIHELPPVLILHLKRFSIGPFQVTKNSNYMSFTPMLDVAPYCSNTCLEVCLSEIVYIEMFIVIIFIC